MTSKKSNVLEVLFKECQKKNDYVFHNILVKEISRKIGVGNPFDVTKLDKKSKLPQVLLDKDYAVIHLGNGYHKFVKGIDKVYHTFEPIQKEIEWKYRKSLLNLYNTSESNVISIANNQRILHHFLFSKDKEFDDVDIKNRPKTYFPHRTKESFEYYFDKDTLITCDNIQIEIDLTIEYQGHVGVFEVKNGTSSDFIVYQLYHPYLYYFIANKKPNFEGKIKDITCVYLIRDEKEDDLILKFWAYTFINPYDITSIKLIKSVAYKLIKET
ncbi:MAG: hypothetical protein FWG98_00565 [Candidatus Cloacimonetes bacterium]|nr:hypothetical protein [Candidatus Cloacimonadota bacterium]